MFDVATDAEGLTVCNYMNEKAEFAVHVLKQYAHENQVPARSTSDLSPMEQWLILRLLAVSKQSEQLFCHHEGKYTLKSDGNCCKCNLPPKPST
jgi:hypothetical protein